MNFNDTNKMENLKQTITIEIVVKTTIEKTWKSWTNPKHIVNWSFASEDWHSPEAENDLRIGGKFRTKMATKDGSASFDFEGKYTSLEKYKTIQYIIADGRVVTISFEDLGESTKVTETFDPENIHSLELQKDGWQAILNNFKKYTETI